MEFRIQETCDNIDWGLLRDTLKEVEMGYCEPELHRCGFENSFAVVFVFDRGNMIGFGRAISDGAYQAAIYDVAVVPAYQGRGVGRLIVERLLTKISNCNVLLYSSPGKERFYSHLGFAPAKTAMALFRDPEKMRTRGMI
jgi:GNAT superfamily N-acetyltransferase